MKINDIYKMVSETIETMTPVFAECINILTEKILISNGENIDENGIVIIEDFDHEEITDEDFEKITKIENFLFNSFGNLIKAKESLGEELNVTDAMIKLQYETEMAEALEMYREYKNTEDILNEENNTKNEE